MNKISLGGRGHKGLYKTQEMPGTKHKRIPDSSWNQSALGLAQDTRQPSVNQIISSPYLDHLLLRDVRVVILMTRSVFGDDDYFNGKVFSFFLWVPIKNTDSVLQRPNYSEMDNDFW